MTYLILFMAMLVSSGFGYCIGYQFGWMKGVKRFVRSYKTFTEASHVAVICGDSKLLKEVVGAWDALLKTVERKI